MGILPNWLKRAVKGRNKQPVLRDYSQKEIIRNCRKFGWPATGMRLRELRVTPQQLARMGFSYRDMRILGYTEEQIKSSLPEYGQPSVKSRVARMNPNARPTPQSPRQPPQ